MNKANSILSGLAAFLTLVSAPTVHADAQAISSSGAPNRLSATERDAGWKLLFNGQTLDGWRGLGYVGIPAAHWIVEDGTIKKVSTKTVNAAANGAKTPGGDLMTEATFKDFELQWDWKMTAVGNSGLKYNVSEALSVGDTSAQQTLRPATGNMHSAIGFEYQLLDDDKHPDGKLVTRRSGALYDMIAPNDGKKLMPIGEWNHSAIIFKGNHGEHWLNGVKVLEYDLDSPAFKAAFAASKYKSYGWFPNRRTGHIILQDHGDDVYFRNLKIRELAASR